MTRFITHFGFQSTAAEVIAGVDLTGRKAIVTGGAAGVGAETVRALAGASVVVDLVVSDPVHVAKMLVGYRRVLEIGCGCAIRRAPPCCATKRGRSDSPYTSA
jgi:hypothetical protein